MTWILTRAKEILELFLTIAAVVAILWKLFGKKWYDRYRKNRDSWRDKITDNMSTFSLRIESMEKNFKPNGGTSLMDKIITNSDILKSHSDILDQLVIGQRMTRQAFNMMYWESDAVGKVVDVSENLCDLLGCDQNQVLGNSWIGLILQEDRRRVIDSWKQSVENASMFKEQFTFIGCGENRIKVIASASHNKDKSQKLISSLVKFTVINS